MSSTANEKWCQNCAYVYKDDESGIFLSKYYCTKIKDSSGYMKRVSFQGRCDNFTPRDTAESSNYKGNCFLTSACVEYQGKADDCEELTVLRAFRDGYMRKTEDGEQLVKKYYEVAPKIVEHINSSDNKNKYYQYISEVVDKCVKFIAMQENERALTEYKFMVENLSKEFMLA